MDFPNATGFRFQREILNEALTAGASKALHSGRALSSTGKPKRFGRGTGNKGKRFKVGGIEALGFYPSRTNEALRLLTQRGKRFSLERQKTLQDRERKRFV